MGTEFGGAFRRAAGAACVLFVVTACGSSPSDSASVVETSTDGAVASTSSSAASKTSAPVPASVRIPSNDGLSRGIEGVSTGCDGTRVEKDRGGSLFDPSTGKFLDLPVPQPSTGAQLLESFCVIAGKGEDLRVVYIFTERTPASGLTVEKTETYLVSFEKGSNAPSAKVLWPSDVDGVSLEHVLPTNGGVLAANWYKGTSVMFDLESLTSKWQRVGTPIGTTDDGVAFSEKFANEKGVNIDGIIFVNAETGQEVHKSVDAYLPPQNMREGFGVNHLDKLWFFDTKRNRMVGPIGDKQTPVVTVSVYNDKVYVLTRDGLRAYDLEGTSSVPEVLTTGPIPSGLSSGDVVGDYLYIANIKDGNSVVDIKTGEKVADARKLRPLDRIGEWTVVVDGPTVTNSNFRCFTHFLRNICHEPIRLVRDVDGKYPGPWY